MRWWGRGQGRPGPAGARGSRPVAFFMLGDVTIQRMDNVAIVVDDLDAAVAFFAELGMELEGKAEIEGLWADRTVGLDGLRSDIAMMRTPDGHGKVELTKYHNPAAARPAEPAAQHAGLASLHVRRRRHRRHHSPPARPRRRTPRRGGAVREHLPALLPPRPRGHHRRPSRTDRLTRPG